MKYKSGLVTDLSGSIGGLTASRNRGGGYFRARVNPVQPNTCRQNTSRAIFSELARDYANLTQSDRDDWDHAAASNFERAQEFCGSAHITGQNFYISQNFIRKQVQEELDNALPLMSSPPTPTTMSPPALGVTPFENTGANIWAFDINMHESPGADYAYVVYAGLPQNPGRNFYAGPWQITNYTPVSAANPETTVTVDVTDPDDWASSRIPLNGKRMPLRIVVLNELGEQLNSYPLECIGATIEGDTPT